MTARNELTAHAEQVLLLNLERERARLVHQLRSLEEASRALGEGQAEEGAAGGDQADVASDLAQQEVDLTLEHVERARLAQVDAAIRRLAEDRYGLCEHCGEPIGFARLRALPWVRSCRRCVEQSLTGAAHWPAPAG
jgi:DnaK suppressor protein